MSIKKSAHVLVVEDEPLAGREMARYLARKGYRLSMADDGTAGLRVHQSDPVDVVVTDIRMPRSDGNELIRELRRDNPDLPIIVVTGGLERQVDEDRQGGFFVVLKKPISLRELGQIVARATKNTEP